MAGIFPAWLGYLLDGRISRRSHSPKQPGEFGLTTVARVHPAACFRRPEWRQGDNTAAVRLSVTSTTPFADRICVRAQHNMRLSPVCHRHGAGGHGSSATYVAGQLRVNKKASGF